MAGWRLNQDATRPGRIAPDASRAVAVSTVSSPTVIVLTAGATWTDDTGTLATVAGTLALREPVATVMAAVPGAIAVTRPELDTVATLLLFELQDTGADISLPSWSSTRADSCDAWPAMMLGAPGRMVMLLGRRLRTLTLFVATMPSEMALMFVEPSTMPLMTPAELTVATPGLADCHAMVRPSMGCPEELMGMAVACRSTPMRAVSDGIARVSDVAGRLRTLMVALPVLLPAVAVITTVPADLPMTTPSWSTLAFR